MPTPRRLFTRKRVPLTVYGVATALKRATIAWSAANGIEALETANDTDNAPMRAVNHRLGYQPLPDEIYFRGSVEAS